MKKIVIKIGTTIATSKRGKIDRYRFEHLAKQLLMLRSHDMGILLVVSAAVVCGEQKMRLKQNHALAKQLVGGVGQAEVIAQLSHVFNKHSLAIGQLLLTKDDLSHQGKKQRIKQVIDQALEQNILLIINENDIVELHSFKGNDHLSVEVAKLIHADYLILCTDVSGVLDKNLQNITSYTSTHKLTEIEKVNSRKGVGGIQGKLKAARIAANNGINTWIVDGRTENLLTRMFLNNEHIGTNVLGGMI